MHWLTTILFILCACSHTPSAEDKREIASLLPPDPETQLIQKQAMDHFSEGNYPRAIQEIQAALLLTPHQDNTLLSHLLFYSYLATGNYSLALATAESNLKEQPFQPMNYQELGLAQLWSGKAKDAVESLRRALEFESHSPKTHFYLALAYAKLNRNSDAQTSLKDAETEYSQILAKNPEDFEANFELAAQYAFTEAPIEKLAHLIDTARNSLSRSTEGDTSRLIQQFQLPVLEGILHLRRGNLSVAKNIFIDAIKSCPSGAKADLAEVYYYLAESARLSEDSTSAKSFYQQSIELDPQGPFESRARSSISKIN